MLATRIIETARYLGLDTTTGIVNSPLFRDGEVYAKDGYDPVTGGYLSRLLSGFGVVGPRVTIGAMGG